MAAGPYPWPTVKVGDDPNDPSKTGGTYEDAIDKMSPEQKSPLVNFPKAPDPQPFKINGGMG